MKNRLFLGGQEPLGEVLATLRQRLSPFIPLALVALLLGLILRFGAEIARWSRMAEPVLSVPPLSILTTLALLLPMLAAILFHQTRVVLVAGLLASVCFLSNGELGTLSGPSIALLGPILLITTVLLFHLRERGLFNRHGALRLVLSAAPLTVLVYADSSMPAIRKALSPQVDVLFQPVPSTHTSPGTMILTGLALIALFRLRGTEYPVIAPSLAVALVLALIGLDAPSPLWSAEAGSVVRPLAFATSGLTLLWCVYLLTWGRAYQDMLTGLPGRRALEERLEQLSGTYALAMVDIDRFKRFNDRYGHQTGDDVLRLVAAILDKHGPGKAYRYGGEEFTLVCPGRGAPTLKDDLDQLRARIASTKLTLRKQHGGKKKGSRLSVTASFGLAERSAQRPTPEQVIKAADRALYRAKRAGRNRIHVA